MWKVWEILQVVIICGEVEASEWGHWGISCRKQTVIPDEFGVVWEKK